MKTSRKRTALNLFIKLFFALPLPFIWLLVAFAPFGSLGARVVPSWTIGPVLGVVAVQAILIHSVLAIGKRVSIYILLAAFAAFSVTAVIIAGIMIHQDFISAFFMFLIQLIVLVLIRNDTVISFSFDNPARRKLYTFGLAASILFTIWIILMGYALVTRQEPRWWESILYNLYNSVLAGILFTATMGVAKQPARIISLDMKTFEVDSLDFSPLLGESGCSVAWALLSTRNAVTCSELLEYSGKKRCESCSAGKASQCPDYRSLYNTVRIVKQLLESLRLGTVRAPENKRNITSEGWRFVASDRLQIVPRNTSVPIQ